MEEKITIIEGPPPTFESVQDGWVLGLNEGTMLANVALTRLRTFNGLALVERCHRSWSRQERIFLEYRGSEGLIQNVPILAARNTEIPEGQLLLLWVRLAEEEVGLQLGYDDTGNDQDDDPGFPDL